MPPCSNTVTSIQGNNISVDAKCSSSAAKEQQDRELLSLILKEELSCLQNVIWCSDNCINIIKQTTNVDQVSFTKLVLRQCPNSCHNCESEKSSAHEELKPNNCCFSQKFSACRILQENRESLQHGMALHGSGNEHENVQNDSGYGSGGAYPSHHYHRPPCDSQTDLEKLEKNQRELSQCCFYFGSIDSPTSKELLRKTPVGTFLIRDSSHSGYLYTLSVKTERGATSVRIVYNKGLFQFDSDERIRNKLPQFDSVLGLVDFHVMVTHDGGNKSWQWEEMSGHRSMKATLTKPLKSSVSSLAHLSRVKINQCLDNAYISQVVDTLPVNSNEVREFLKEYPYRI